MLVMAARIRTIAERVEMQRTVACRI